MRGTRGMRTPPPPQKKKIDFSLQRERGVIIASQRRLLIAGLEEPKITLQAVLNEMSKEKHKKSERTPLVSCASLGAGVQPRSTAQLFMPVGDQGQLTALPLAI